jgi:hypothetical protein
MTHLPSDQVTSAREYIQQAQDVLIVVRSNPTLDSMASALAFYLAISANGKRASVVCPDSTTVEFSHLIGVDKVSNSISGGTSGKNLVISFPYEEGSIEKVSYNIEGSLFNLVIEPRENYPMITPDMMQYKFSGGNTDVIITINVSRLDDLDSLFQSNQGLFSEKPVINIDTNPQNGRFGRSNIVDPTSSCVSELTTNLLSQLGYQIDADAASNLLQGISAGSQNFTSTNTSASTFEAAALCLKNGAQKPQPQQQVNNYQFPTGRPQPKSAPMPFPKPQMPTMQPPVSRPQPMQQQQQPIHKPNFGPSPMQQRSPAPLQQPHHQPQSPVQSHQQPQQQPINNGSVTQQKQDAPPDWLKPKIYKGSSLL